MGNMGGGFLRTLIVKKMINWLAVILALVRNNCIFHRTSFINEHDTAHPECWQPFVHVSLVLSLSYLLSSLVL